jgi:hypothetical protein
MAELAYPVGHPKHPDFKGVAQETHGSIGYDYEDSHPARGGLGQPVPIEPTTERTPREGFRHLYGLDLSTLANALKEFHALPKAEQEERMEWNANGIPADVLERE